MKNTSAMQFVRYALAIGALELVPEGRKLKSGRMSPYFFNSGLFNSNESLSELAKAYAAAAQEFVPDVVFGPAYKGIPLAVATALAMPSKVGYAFDRKEEKDHGDGGIIVGMPITGKRVVIIDDVITSGGSFTEAFNLISKLGGIPVGGVISFNRQERGKDSDLSAVQEFEQKFGIPVRAAATREDLISVLEATPAESGDDAVGEILEKILAYSKEYGAQ